MKKVFENRAEYNTWYNGKEKEMRDAFQAEHPEYDFYDLFERADEWGMQSEEDVYAAAEQDGYDVNHLREQINDCWGKKIL